MAGLSIVKANGGDDDARKRNLYAWADGVLGRIGLAEAIKLAKTIRELNSITIDLNSPEIRYEIQDALHPATEEPKACFQGLVAGSLKRAIDNRFRDAKPYKERDLRERRANSGETPWEAELTLRGDKVVPSLRNLVLTLRHSPQWQGVLWFSEFEDRVVIRKRAPWGYEKPDTTWADHHEPLTAIWFQEREISPSISVVRNAVRTAARDNPFNPVRDLLESFKWDGEIRGETWMPKYLNVEDSPYVRAIGPRQLISMVVRAYQPGAKVDTVLILEGDEGLYKSEAIRTLACRDEWYTDQISHLGHKDSSGDLVGIRFVEFSDMAVLEKATRGQAKSFITRRVDYYRPSYGRYRVRWPRQATFFATVNPLGKGYLTDPTGARRYWPIRILAPIDLVALEQVRDQLIAEAVHRFKAGEQWWLDPGSNLEALAVAEQDARFVRTIWDECVLSWISTKDDVSISEIMAQALGMPEKDWTQKLYNEISNILTKSGFSSYRSRVATTTSDRSVRYRRNPLSTTPKEQNDG